MALKEKVAFQNALGALTHNEFEGLAAIVLQIAGCTYIRRTPASHDQGIDAFGYSEYFTRQRGTWLGGMPRITFLAQAKHYSECRVGTKDIREFVGSYNLALHKIYSTVDKRYQELSMPPFGPAALIFLTSEEIPRTVKLIASRSGIVVLSSDDLCDILMSSVADKPIAVTKDWLISTWVQQMELIAVAK